MLVAVRLDMVMDFNPLPPCGGRPLRLSYLNTGIYFNPLPPCGGRLDAVSKIANHVQFQSTPSVWRETAPFKSSRFLYNISIHSLRVEGDFGVRSVVPKSKISIHSLRVEGDSNLASIYFRGTISIHSLRVEGDRKYWTGDTKASLFQSTPSVWRETCYIRKTSKKRENFNPLPPCGGRRIISSCYV